MESIGEIPDRGVRVIADGTAEDVRASWAMPSDDLIPRVRLLIANLRLQLSPDVPSPQDVCRHVALQLGVSEARAGDIIMKAALQDAERTHQDDRS